MMKRIMTTGGAAVALAASAFLFAPPAAADHGAHRSGKSYHSHGGRYRSDDHGRYANTRQLRRNAVRTCRRAIRDEGYYKGFHDIDFEDRRVRQVGPAGFIVRYETEFEGRRREFERNVYCEVRRGRIVALEGIPQPGRYRQKRRYGHRGY